MESPPDHSEKDAFSRRLAEFQPQLRRRVMRHWPLQFEPIFSSEDMVQQVNIAAWEERETITDISSESFRGWIETLADDQMRLTFQMLDGQGVNGVSLGKVAPDGGSTRLINKLSPASLAAAREMKSRLRAAVKKLSRSDQEILGMRFQQGLDFKAVASALGRAPDAVRQSCHRAILRLQRYLRRRPHV